MENERKVDPRVLRASAVAKMHKPAVERIDDPDARCLCAHPEVQKVVPPDCYVPSRESLKGLSRKTTTQLATKMAQAVCALCPIQEACLDKALEPVDNPFGEQVYLEGIWGGMTDDQRNIIRKKRNVRR